MPTITRRSALVLSSTLAAAAATRAWPALADEPAAVWPDRLSDGWTESYGLSAFGELGLPADFSALAYVNVSAPKAAASCWNRR